VTKISPTNGSFPQSTAGAEAEFSKLVETLNGPIQMALKKEIIWSKRDPLHFWQSLAFSLRSEELTCIALSSFVDTFGQNKLYIASNERMTAVQQQEVTEIINMFLVLRPYNEIIARLLPRHLPYVVKQFKKINLAQMEAFTQEFPSQLSEAVETMFHSKGFSLDDIRQLLNLIVENKKTLRAMKDGTLQGISEPAKKMAYHLCKMDRVGEEIHFVWKKVRRHKEDPILQSISRDFQFVSLGCHAELAILKIANDCCASRTLYIGVSKRPCYCCSLFFEAVQENKSTDFRISIVTTHGKLYGRWNKIEGCFEKEFIQVWAKVIEEIRVRAKRLHHQTHASSNSD
jgi:hypothetical protein